MLRHALIIDTEAGTIYVQGPKLCFYAGMTAIKRETDNAVLLVM